MEKETMNIGGTYLEKAATLLIVCLLLLLICACSKQNNSPDAYFSSSSTTSSPTPKIKTLTQSEIKSKAASALYNELSRRKNLKENCAIDETTYSIGSVVDNGDYSWSVKGTFTLYDYYGRFYKSGTFDATVYSYGGATCFVLW